MISCNKCIQLCDHHWNKDTEEFLHFQKWRALLMPLAVTSSPWHPLICFLCLQFYLFYKRAFLSIQFISKILNCSSTVGRVSLVLWCLTVNVTSTLKGRGSKTCPGKCKVKDCPLPLQWLTNTTDFNSNVCLQW